jgi:hypothetical protein
MDDDDDERDAVKLAGKMQQELERRDTRPVGVKMMLGAAFMMLLLVVGAVPIKTDAIPSTFSRAPPGHTLAKLRALTTGLNSILHLQPAVPGPLALLPVWIGSLARSHSLAVCSV